MEKATFGAGCFWGVEVAFANIPGVTATAVGYEGGKTQAPTYKDVCTDATGHTEVVEVDFDPAKVTFGQLLDAFFTLHDPTQLPSGECRCSTAGAITHQQFAALTRLLICGL